MKNVENHAITQFQTALISKIERFQGAFEATKFQRKALIDGLKKTTIITSSGASTRIEGAMLNDDQVQELVEKGCIITKVSSRSEREVAGYMKAINYIYDNHEKLNISKKTIREIHQLLTSELTEDQLPSKQRSAYKDIPNDVVEKNTQTGETIQVWFKTTPPGPETESAMQKFISEYHELKERGSCHPLILLGAFIVKFLAIHPFRDGNGRLSRLLTIFLLIKHDYKWTQYASHEKIIEDNKEGYYISLRETQSTLKESKPNFESWLNFFLKVISLQTDFLKGKIIKESPLSVMNENEKIVYGIIEQSKQCNISHILKQTEMTRPGLKTLIKRLLDRGVITKEGRGKGTTYSIQG